MTKDEMLAEANRLVQLQRDERGYTKGKDLEGKPCLHLNPYVSTEASQIRAAQILDLRRRAAAMEDE